MVYPIETVLNVMVQSRWTLALAIAVVLVSLSSSYELHTTDLTGVSHPMGPRSALRTSTSPTPPATWTQFTGGTHPSTRTESMMVWDAADSYFVLFGGEYMGPGYPLYLGDTWTLSYSSQSGWVWSQVKFLVQGQTQTCGGPSPQPSCGNLAPSIRHGGAMAYDSKDGYVLLFGGSDASSYLGDTWTYLAGTWTQHTLTTSPSPRRVAGIADIGSSVVLFGGHGGASNCLGTPSCYVWFSDTWEYVAGGWTQLAPPSGPSGRAEPGMTFDPNDGYVLLFGGWNFNPSIGKSVTLQDTWELRGSVWTNISATITTTPPSRDGAQIAYDPSALVVVMFGGHDGLTEQQDFWWYSAGVWTQYYPALPPGGRDGIPLAWDPAGGLGIMFGGEILTPGPPPTKVYVSETWALA